MSDLKEVCQFCSGEIVFRIIRGRTVPIHIGKDHCEGKKLYRREQEGIAHPTTCPHCGGFVIFLRNNGGSVWLDSLGWPWPKHACFEGDVSSSTFPRSSRLEKDAKLQYVKHIGILSQEDGFVVTLFDSKEFLRKNPRYRIQWKILCARELAEMLGPKLDGKCVLVSFEQKRLMTLASDEFPIERHVPRYYSKFNQC